MPRRYYRFYNALRLGLSTHDLHTSLKTHFSAGPNPKCQVRAYYSWDLTVIIGGLGRVVLPLRVHLLLSRVTIWTHLPWAA